MVVMKLKIYKSPGPDSLHPRVLNELADTISIQLSIIFKTSLTTGMLPTHWKKANISAIHKKGNKQTQNYRPVSLTSVVGKILEAIIRDTISQHINNNVEVGKTVTYFGDIVRSQGLPSYLMTKCQEKKIQFFFKLVKNLRDFLLFHEMWLKKIIFK